MAGVVTGKLEVEFVAGSGTFVDISSQVTGWTITRPRYTLTGGASPTQLTVELLNDPVGGVCQLSPDSPLSPYFPNMVANRLVRATAVWAGGASTSVRFLGFVDEWKPDAGDNPPATATVTLTASCILSKHASRSTLSFYAERVLMPDATAVYYPFNEAADADTARAVSRTMTDVYDGQVIQPRVYPGSATFNSPDGGHLTDGQIDFTRGDDNTPAPVVLCKLRPVTGSTARYFSGWFKLAADPKGSFGDDMLTGYDANGDLLWTFSVKVAATLVTWGLYEADGTPRVQFVTGAPRDEGWHYWAIRPNSATSVSLFTRTKGDTGQQAFGSSVWSYDPRPVQYLVVGGRMPPFRPGRNSNTFLGSISSLLVQYDAATDYAGFGNPAVVGTANSARDAVTRSTAALDTLVGGAATIAFTDTTPVQYGSSTANALERINLLARTIGGAVTTRPDGQRLYLRAADMRPAAVSLTLDAEQDLSAPDGGWQGTKDERPTRQTVTGPPGTVEVIDAAREATGLRTEGSSIETMAGTLSVAQSVAGQVLSAAAGRISAFGVDVSTTSTDKTATIMALRGFQRIRISGLPTALTGLSYVDVYQNGTTETLNAEDQSYRFQFDSDPADDPPEGVFDDAARGRFGLSDATVTAGTCLGTTATGTVVITSASGVLTTTVGEFTMDLNWNGEIITVSGVGGGTSPQTVTVTARGEAPSVARVHSTGEPIDLNLPLTFGP